MKKILALIVVALVAGSAYIYFLNPEMKEQITSSVAKIVAGSEMQSADTYEKDLKKEGIILEAEKEAYIAGVNESLTVSTFKDVEGGSLLLAHNDDEVQVMRAVFDPENSSVGDFVNEEFSRIFQENIDLSTSGKTQNEYGEASWELKNGKVTLLINSKDVAKTPAVEDLPEDQQKKLTQLRELIAKKVKMQDEWRKLDDEKHFCLDQSKFKVITSRMAELKDQAEKLTVNAKEIMRDLPMPQIMALKEELEGGHL